MPELFSAGGRFAGNLVFPFPVSAGMNSSHSTSSLCIRQLAAVSVMSGAISLLAGCYSEPESHIVSAPPPPSPQTQVVVAQTQPAPVVVTGTAQTSNGTIIVMQAPPPIQQELILAQPSSEHKWVPGYWTWRNSRYEWMAGHWALPPNSVAVWIAPRWERTSDGGYRFYEGYWN
jgi:hypothetical protein